MEVGLRRIIVIGAWTLMPLLGIAAGLATHQLWLLRSEIERLADRLTLEIGPESTLVYDGEGRLLTALYEQHRIGISLEQVSPHLIDAVLAIEDKRFFDHAGVDPQRIVKAAIANARAGTIVQGGSTITQQLVRAIALTREKRYERKLKEALLARRLEERFGKRAILEAYLNRVYFGEGYYGAEAAAIGYFGKSAADLDVVEAATLAGLIKGPSLYAPTRAAERAGARRDLVLHEMRAEGMVSDQELQAALAVPVVARLARGERERPDPRRAPIADYFEDAVARELVNRFGAEAVYRGGMRVYTTLDRRIQAAATTAIAERLARLATTAKTDRNGDRRDRDALQGALVAIEPGTGHVKALVGGRDYLESPFNRAIDARRQPGSAFKPFIYAMALESGYLPSSRLYGLDEPIDTRQGPWLPGGEHETASIRLREGLVVSSNRAAVHLLQEVGVQRTRELVSRFGVTSPMPAVPSLALGTGEMTLFELTAAYGVFANRGVWRAPVLIRRVLDREGREIYRAANAERRVVSETTAFLMTSMMQDVVTQGTASTMRSAGFRHRAAGKTGTSDDYTDAWFVGYTPRLVAGVWFGYDLPRPIMRGGFGGVVAVPAWARFMSAASDAGAGDWFAVPASLTPVTLCRLSGDDATDRCHLPIEEHVQYEVDGVVMTSAIPVRREGGVYRELRPVGRSPQPCSLPHGRLTARLANEGG